MFDWMKALFEIIRTAAAGISIYIFLRKVRKWLKNRRTGPRNPSI